MEFISSSVPLVSLAKFGFINSFKRTRGMFFINWEICEFREGSVGVVFWGFWFLGGFYKFVVEG